VKAVYAHIERRNAQFKELPLFAFLRDESVAPVQRLTMAPYLAFFVMSFGDFNRLVLRDADAGDPYQEMVNRHSHEDDDHWEWLLSDLIKLGHGEAKASLPEHIRFLWGSETEKSRMLAYRLCGLVYKAPPLLKLAVIEALELSGQAFFDHLTPIAAKIRAQNDLELSFFGHVHLNQELGHVANEVEISNQLRSVELDPALRARALEAVDVSYDALCDFMNEAWAYTSKRLPNSRRAG
jgi:hypothetical protein